LKSIGAVSRSCVGVGELWATRREGREAQLAQMGKSWRVPAVGLWSCFRFAIC
jgi:hypothetical protein